jgi:hypothetical protein
MRRFVYGWLALCSVACSSVGVRADDAKAIIEKGIAAVGGAEKLGKNKALTWKAKGKVDLMGNSIEFSGDWSVQPPKQMKNQIEIDFNGMKTAIVSVINGDKGWRSFAGNTMELEGDDLAEAKEELYAGRVSTLLALTTEPGFKLASLGESKVGDKTAVGVKVSHEGHRDISLFFDKDSGLLIKNSRRIKDIMAGGQEMDQDTFLSDYQDFDGVKRYKKMSIKRDGKDFIELQISEYKAVESLPDATFSKPGE